MAELKVRQLDERTVAALKARARKRGVSLEEEVRATLTAAVLARRDAFVKREDRFVDHRQQNSIGDESRIILAVERRFAHFLGKRANFFVSFVRGGDAADDFDELHQRNRIHKMHPDDLFRSARHGGDFRDRDRRRVRS